MNIAGSHITSWVSQIEKARYLLQEHFDWTPLVKNVGWSSKYGANVYFKREDLHVVRSYKIRGAFVKMLSLSDQQRKKAVVCASAGNHAQGVAYAASHLGMKAKIYMPLVTPKQKVERVKLFGGEFIEIIILGDSFDEAYQMAINDAEENELTFIHPFEDQQIIEGQGTVGLEILSQVKKKPDYLFLPIGGGGLATGVSSYFKHHSPETAIIGVEPSGAAAMKMSIESDEHVRLDQIDTFVDGAAVRQVGRINFEVCRNTLDKVVTVKEGKVCSTILKLYNEEAIVAEPAGALSIAALDDFKDDIRGKEVVCVLSGGNNDVLRMEEIKERSLLHEGLKHYFIIQFPQRSGALKDFLNVLGPTDDIAHFEYTKKTNRETGAALVGIELKKAKDYEPLIMRMVERQIRFQTINDNPMLFDMLV